jgi:hypothetical protein|tara:strand:- start:1610 stop:1741 length:132 start_codon:yes stop_codon:yes gene_type:complete
MADSPALFEYQHLFGKFISQIGSRVIDCVKERFYGTLYDLYTE